MRLGESLCSAGRITLAQLEEALAEQQHCGLRLGDILVKQGAITQSECDIAMDFQRRVSGAVPTAGLLKLGEILVATGQIKREHLEQSLSRQKLTGKKLGEDLIAAGHIQQHQIDRALQLQRRLVSTVLSAAISLGGFIAPAEAAAGMPATSGAMSGTANVAVTATVLKRANLNVLAQPATVEITAADIARGYVDVPAATRVEIKSNSPQGYMLMFEGNSDFVRQTQVRGMGNAVQFGASGGGIFQRWSGHGVDKAVVELGFRFILAEGVSPGTHAWPMQLSVMPQ